MQIEVTRDVIDAIKAAAEAAYPYEACGLLLGDGARISQFLETRNVHAAPRTHFEIDPQALIDAHRAEREGGPKVMGYFHSHPHGSACPSKTDRQQAAPDGKIWAIASRSDERFYQSGKRGFEALGTAILDG
ncbi:MAG: M67 family metallopeptidase [Pseudomonadota bacterium]